MMVAEKDSVGHQCKELEGAPFTVEDRGEGWFLYTGTDRGPNPINFCPCCGLSLPCESYSGW